MMFEVMQNKDTEWLVWHTEENTEYARCDSVAHADIVCAALNRETKGYSFPVNREPTRGELTLGFLYFRSECKRLGIIDNGL